MLVSVALVLLAQAPADDLRSRVERQPRRVVEFLERRADCVHWAGEEPYDAARRREIEKGMRASRCGRLDRDEATLRRIYARDPEVLALIDETRDLVGW